ncbi:hypothetical protein AB0J01_27620 [Streptomyces sp. NPDC050204]|uniref:hypothetical protein n=1 Tax=Streptomyces sp. NPDC050204 TaxID=3155514 RepID=UPI00341BEA2F
MTGVRVRAERAANTVGYGLATGLAGVLVGAVTGGLGWAVAIGGAAAVAGGKVGQARPDSVTRRNARLTSATARCLSPLRREGWHLIHARPIGQDPDRVYHLCVPPSANRVVVVMDWAWPPDVEVSLDGSGNLHAGAVDGEIAVDWLLHAADTVGSALDGQRKALGRIGLAQVLPVHGALVGNGGHVQFHRDHNDQNCEINVVHADVLADKMRTVPSGTTRGTRRVAGAFAKFLDNAFPE